MRLFKLRGRNVSSSKNSKRWTGKILINSRQSMEYYEFVLPLLASMKMDILSEMRDAPVPYRFHFFFHRDTRRRFDYLNVCQILADAFQKAGILADDDALHFIPVFVGFDVDRQSPGVDFWIEK